jgi:hypothetical protein
MTHFNIGEQNLGPHLDWGDSKDDERAHSSPRGSNARSAMRSISGKSSNFAVVAGVLRAWLFGLRCLTADMLDQGDVAFQICCWNP